MKEEIIPDGQSIRRVARIYRHKSEDAHKGYALCQKDVWNRLAGGVLSADGRTWKFPNGKREVTEKAIREHNRKTEETDEMSVLNPSWRWRPVINKLLQELELTREEYARTRSKQITLDELEPIVAKLRQKGFEI